MRYSTILIDADDTIFDFYAAEEYALAATLRELGYTKPLTGYMPQFREINARAWAEYEAGRATSREIRVRRFVELLSLLSVTAEPEAVSNSYVKHLSESAHLLPGARSALDSIYQKLQSLDPTGSMVMVTNGLSSVQHPRIDAAAIRELFDAVVVSEEVGVQKPDPQIFEIAMAAADTDADLERSVMIGDGLRSDILGAQKTGIDSIWVNVRNRPRDPSIRPTYETDSISTALTFLE